VSEHIAQRQQILGYLRLNGSITPIDALERFNCFRLGARIWDLKHEGIPIESKLENHNGKKYSRYYLAADENGQCRMALQ
jgi:hypothetical protein